MPAWDKCLVNVRRFAGGFARDRRASVAILFALALIPMLGAIGVALDYSRANSLRSKLQASADAAALAAGRDRNGTEDARRKIAEEVFAANSTQLKFTNSYILTYADLDDGTAARIDVTAKIPTTVSGILGIDEVEVHVRAQTGLSGGSMEVALVVDNSGSMDGSRISSLKNATRSLVDTLLPTNATQDKIAIGIVPFAAAVNVGSTYASASWMDKNGVSSIHHKNLDSTTYTRFQLFSNMGVSWEGCVETRPYPLDVQDTAPSSSTPDSYFVPLFAPDEPGDRGAINYYKYYYNSYLNDYGGSCPSGTSGYTDTQLERRACKYIGGSAKTGPNSVGTQWGPNFLCDSKPLTPLTYVKNTLSDAIAQFSSYGGTNIHEGIMWGWRILSPGEPFTQGKAYSDDQNTKIMIVMSDGANFHSYFSNINKSWFSAYGYSAENRLGSSLTSTSQLVAAMNARTLEACTNVKAAGILIYTIAFDIDDADTLQLLSDCASSTAMTYNTSTTTQMVAAFEDIAKNLGDLRLAK